MLQIWIKLFADLARPLACLGYLLLFLVNPVGVDAQFTSQNLQNPRRTVSLDGAWEFRPDNSPNWRMAQVPLPLEVNFPDLRGRSISGEYRKNVEVPLHWTGRPWLVIGAANYTVRVIVNDRFVGSAESGYIPVAFDLSNAVRPGETARISIFIANPAPGASAGGVAFSEIPHGNQAWLGTASGLWQSVWLEERPVAFVRSLKIDTDLVSNSADIDIELSQTPPGASGTIFATIYAPGASAPVARLQQPLSSSTRYLFQARIPSALRWSPSSPNLYTVNVSVVPQEGPADQFSSRFGFRKLEYKEGRFYMNGQLIFLTGVLDRDIHPGSHYTIPPDTFMTVDPFAAEPTIKMPTAYLREQFEAIKKLGFNLIRVHQKIPDQRYLQMADEMGILIWYELPGLDNLTQKGRSRVADLFSNLAIRDYNHPSLVIISLGDRSRGLGLEVAENRKWLVSATEYVRNLYSHRLVIDNTTDPFTYSIKPDFGAMQVFFDIPDQAALLQGKLSSLEGLQAGILSRSEIRDFDSGAPVLIAGFASWGLPNIQTLPECSDGRNPWWFSTGPERGTPGGVTDRFTRYGLRGLFGDFPRFARATQEAQLLSLKWQIEEFRLASYLSGFILNQIADSHWEATGLMDSCRILKTSARVIPYLTARQAVIGRPSIRSGRSGDSVRVDLFLSNWDEEMPQSGSLEWMVEGFPEIRGEFALPAMGAGELAKVESLEFILPSVTQARTIRLGLKWKISSSSSSQNYVDIAVYPTLRESPRRLRVYVHPSSGGSPAVLDLIRSVFGEPAQGILDADIVLTGILDDTLERWISEGGRTVVVPAGIEALPAAFGGVRLVDRGIDSYRQDGISSFQWVDKSSLFASLPLRNQIPDWSFSEIIPKLAIDGIEESGRWQDVHSGVFRGWVSGGMATTLRTSIGNARMLICTFPILESIEDPTAQQILINLIQAISDETFPVNKPVR